MGSFLLNQKPQPTTPMQSHRHNITRGAAEAPNRNSIGPRNRRRSDYALDIVSDKWGQLFEMQLSAEREAQFEMNVLQCERHDRHLLLLVKTPTANDRFLCGHDEREWFVAAVPGGASSVTQAKLALLPAEVREAADHARLNQGQRTRRHNRAFIRQGEWFFVPAPNLCVDKKHILRNEPIRRGGGKPHMVAEVFRTGGDRVRTCASFPNGITESEHQALIARDPKAARWGWQVRVRNAGVFAARHRASPRPRDHHAARVAPGLDEHREHDAPTGERRIPRLRNGINAAGEGDKLSPAVSFRQKEQTPPRTRSVPAHPFSTEPKP
jgi:hypothetical protein